MSPVSLSVCMCLTLQFWLAYYPVLSHPVVQVLHLETLSLADTPRTLLLSESISCTVENINHHRPFSCQQKNQLPPPPWTMLHFQYGENTQLSLTFVFSQTATITTCWAPHLCMKLHPVDPAAAHPSTQGSSFLGVSLCSSNPYPKLSNTGGPRKLNPVLLWSSLTRLQAPQTKERNTLEELHLPEGNAHSSQQKPQHISRAFVILMA